MEIKKLAKQFRALSAEGAVVDEDKRTVEFPFSSENPVDRWWGREILSHEKSAVDLERAKLGALPLLYNHDSDQLRGKVEKVWFGEDKRLYARARFAKTPAGDEAMNLVKDGMLPNVSFGYTIDEMKLTKDGKGNSLDEYTATRWTPHEVSLVTVPADPTVGVGRSDKGQEFAVTVIKPKIEGKKSMDTDKLPGEQAPAPQPQPTPPKVDPSKYEADGAAKERARFLGITALGETHNQRDLARQLIEGGKSMDEARQAFLEKLQVKQVPVDVAQPKLGLNEKELGKFSFFRAMRALANPADRSAQEDAKFEREVSEATVKQYGKASRGFLVPFEVLAHGGRQGRRDLSAGTAGAGGYAVDTDLMSGSFIDLLRQKSVLQRAGATVLNGLSGNVAIPRMAGGATAYWVAEGGSPTESQLSLDQVTLSPHTVGAFTDITRRLLLQSSIDVENLVKRDLATSMALEIDRAGLYGSGSSNQPLGVKNVSGINTVDFAAAAPTYLEAIALETAVAADNADIGSLAYILNATGRGALKGKERATNTGLFVWEQGNTVNGYRAEVSNQIASGDFWFGNWADLLMGFWSGLDIVVDPYTHSTSGTIRIVTLQDVDFAVRHPESFARGNDTL